MHFHSICYALAGFTYDCSDCMSEFVSSCVVSQLARVDIHPCVTCTLDDLYMFVVTTTMFSAQSGNNLLRVQAIDHTKLHW